MTKDLCYNRCIEACASTVGRLYSKALMDRTFNFFKTKLKKDPYHRHNSKSNSSKCSYSKGSDKQRTRLKTPHLSKKEREIREAIEYRYQKSRMRNYRFERTDRTKYPSSAVSERSSYQEEYKHLKKMFVVDLKEYHRHMDSRSARSSQERQKFKLRFKIKENSSSSAIRTEANDVHDKNLSFLGKTYTKQHRTPTPTKLSKKTEEWKFISIQLKYDLSRPRNRKTEVKINSHRSYKVNVNREKEEEKSAKHHGRNAGSTSGHKQPYKVPRLKDLTKINRSKFVGGGLY